MASGTLSEMGKLPLPNSRLRVLHEMVGSDNERIWCCSFYDERVLQWKTVRMPGRMCSRPCGAISAVSYKPCSTSPSMYFFYRTNGHDWQNLHYTMYNHESGLWEEEMNVPDTGVSGNPTLVGLKNKIFCFHKGLDGALYLNTLHVEMAAWEGEKRLSTSKLQPNIALCAAVFRDNMFCLHRRCDTAVNNFDSCSYEVFDERGQVVLWPACSTNAAFVSVPELAAIEYEGRLYCFHIGCKSGSGLWYNVHTIEESYEEEYQSKVPLPEGALPKGVCVIVGKGCLYCFYRREDMQNSMWYNVLDGREGDQRGM